MTKWPENDLNLNVIGAQILIHSAAAAATDANHFQFSLLFSFFRIHFLGLKITFNVYKPLIIIAFTMQINVPFTYIMMYAKHAEESCSRERARGKSRKTINMSNLSLINEVILLDRRFSLVPDERMSYFPNFRLRL